MKRFILSSHISIIIFTSLYAQVPNSEIAIADTLRLFTISETLLYTSPPHLFDNTVLDTIPPNSSVIAIDYITQGMSGATHYPGYWFVQGNDALGYIKEKSIKDNDKNIIQFRQLKSPVQYRNDPTILGIRQRNNRREIIFRKPFLSDHYRDMDSNKDMLKFYWKFSFLDWGVRSDLSPYSHYASFGILHPETRLGISGGFAFATMLRYGSSSNNKYQKSKSNYFMLRGFPITIYYMPFMRLSRIHEKLDKNGNVIKRSSLLTPIYLFFTFNTYNDDYHKRFIDTGIAWQFSRFGTWRIGYYNDGWEAHYSTDDDEPVFYPNTDFSRIYSSIELNLGWNWRSKELARK